MAKTNLAIVSVLFVALWPCGCGEKSSSSGSGGLSPSGTGGSARASAVDVAGEGGGGAGNAVGSLGGASVNGGATGSSSGGAFLGTGGGVTRGSGGTSAGDGGSSLGTGGRSGEAVGEASGRTRAGTGGRAGGGGPIGIGGVNETGGGTGGAGQASGGSPSTIGGTGVAAGGTGEAIGGTGVGAGGASEAAGGLTGACSRTVGSCAAPPVTVTEIDVGVPVTSYGGEGDTEPFPMAIAALPSGGSRIAWLGTDENVYIAELDCSDELVGSPFSLPAKDLQDIYADAEGGVVLVTRDATGSGADHCGAGPLCGGTSSPCYDVHLVRFDSAGNVEWETKVTNTSDSREPYSDGARFVWWYQHHGRIAFDGTNYAAYFGVAITAQNGNCVDIHEGDRMQVVDPTGALVSGRGEFDFGCSHAWTSRILWDDASDEFVMVCATDNECRIARPAPYRTVAQGECDGTLFGGDLVLSSAGGYWAAWSQGGTIRLQHFTESGPDTSISDAGDSSHPHLVTYGATRMLLAWGSGAALTAQVRDSGNGETVGAPFGIDVSDHDYQSFRAYEDGSVAYPASGSTSYSIKVARVMPCN